ncbi:hypothetical protein C9I86_00360 [Photobacterium sp. NCIMB 13483]|uniref:Uncharacterized protein n=1 Tax=Photobacterium piscicola TaxID=1378299 RepID=A0A1T5HZM0_9GAMM|nr:MULTISPECIES: hypothetical protein [Photobacterium]PST94757.1 hypothetical protein C9I86_00360 [Photobacterium sp. NCIMB 13483]SKC32146.1 hypothetical protein CZ809_01660 [Photobacterium piscicola]
MQIKTLPNMPAFLEKLSTIETVNVTSKPSHLESLPIIATNHSKFISQLPQLLLSMNSLQRLVTNLLIPLNLGTVKSPHSTPHVLQQLFNQLLLPNNQATLITWLQHNTGHQTLATLLQQLSQPSSLLNQWLGQLGPEQQQEFSALLRLAGEQRGPENQRSPDNNNIHLQWVQDNGQTVLLQINNRSQKKTNAVKNNNSQWTVKLSLPIGAIDIMNVIACWHQQQLSTCFECSNKTLLHHIERGTPYLISRLQQLGINSTPPQYKLAPPQQQHQPAVASGLSIKV